MSIIQNLIDDILDEGKSLSTILRRAKVLAYRLENPSLTQWVDKELDGYSIGVDAIPNYRKSLAVNRGNFIGPRMKATDLDIPLSSLPDWVRNFARDLILSDGVASLEQLDGQEGLIPWSGEMIGASQFNVAYDMTMYKAWKVVPPGIVAGVLDTIRNKLLTFALELQKQYPDLKKSDDPIGDVSEEAVTTLVNTYIYGGQNIVASGSNFSVKQDVIQNLDQLVHYLRSLDVPQEELEQLKNVLLLDEESEGKRSFGAKTKEWWANYSANVASTLTTGALANLPQIMQAIQQFVNS